MPNKYSVLMSVYNKENPIYLRESMQSIYAQTLPTDDFVLVCDGPLNDELDQIIDEMKQKFQERLHVYRLAENKGLGIALNYGMQKCKNEYIARMDSDDISRVDRCELQMETFTRYPDISVLSGTINEFELVPNKSTGKRKLPSNYESIKLYSRKRNPINHPCVMFKKSAVLSSGGYKETFHLFEDYYLWIRMLMNGYKFKNIDDILLDMRTSKRMYARRGGMQYAKTLLCFHKWLYINGWSTKFDYISGALPHAIVCILPNIVRAQVYKILH